jgi:hypothetical protein
MERDGEDEEGGSEYVEGPTHRFCGCSFEDHASQRTGWGRVVVIVVFVVVAAAVAPRRIIQAEGV